MDPTLLLALLGLFGQGGNSLFGGYGSTPQNTNYGSGGGLLDLLYSLGLFQNANDQSLGGNNYYASIDGAPAGQGSNLASTLFQYLFGPQAQQAAQNYQQTQPQTQWYNANAPAYTQNPDGTYSFNSQARQQAPAPSGSYQSPYGPAVQQGGTPPPFTGYASPGPQGQGYSPSLGPSGYIEVNGQPTWAPGTGELGGVQGSGAVNRLGLNAGTQVPTAWGPMTVDSNGTWSRPGNLPNLSTVAHGLYGGDVPTMVGPNGEILYNPSGINGQPFDRTKGWVTWDQMDDITTKWYTDRGLPLPAELANANAARAAGHMPQQRASWGNTGFAGYVAPGTTTPYKPSPGYTPPAATAANQNWNVTGTPVSGTYTPITGTPVASAPHAVTGATAGMTGQVPGGKNMVYSPGGIPQSQQQVNTVTKSLGPGFYNPQSYYNSTITNPANQGHGVGGVTTQGGVPQPTAAPKSKSGVAPYWDGGIGKWYDPGTNSYY